MALAQLSWSARAEQGTTVASAAQPGDVSAGDAAKDLLGIGRGRPSTNTLPRPLGLTNTVEERAGLKAAVPLAANTNLAVLTEVIQVRDLPPQEASRGYPVRVTGVLTYCDPAVYKVFIQDDSAGIYLDLTRNKSQVRLRQGQKLEVEGFSGPGDYAPVIHAERMQALGESPLPPAKATTIPMLMTGSEDSQWVAVKGVIRSQSVVSNRTVLALSTADATIQVMVAGTPKRSADFTDATVEVRGVCGTLFNERRRLRGVELYTPEWGQITIEQPAPTDPFNLPIQPIDDLFQFRAGNGGLHRARIQGSVILRRADGSFFVQDATGGVHIQTRKAVPPIRIGAMVEVVGFRGMNEKLPVLQDALVRGFGRTAPVEPVQLDPGSPLNEDLHATLVQLEGRVLRQTAHPAEEVLMAQFGQQVIDVLLEKGPGRGRLGKIVAGSVVKLTGVYVARLDDSRRVQSFQLLLRSPEDVVLISSPVWWTARHTFWILGGLGTVLLVALAWAALLRAQVRQRTWELSEEIEERKRAEEELRKAQGELLQSSRLAGMAEVATSVLHNVGNVLNSVNVSASLISERLKGSKAGNLARVAELMREHAGDLGKFVTKDDKGRQLPDYLGQLAGHLAQEQASVLEELDSLQKNVEHIKDIVAMQQSYAKVAGVTEIVKVTDLVEDVLHMNAGALARHEVQIIREYDPDLPSITVDKHRVLQILVNLIQNAKYACEESGREDKRLTVRTAKWDGRIRISVADNGVGIAPENLTRIFNHGFTTRESGHGFGLHSGALAARELGGALVAQSEGLGKGATFTLELPIGP